MYERVPRQSICLTVTRVRRGNIIPLAYTVGSEPHLGPFKPPAPGLATSVANRPQAKQAPEGSPTTRPRQSGTVRTAGRRLGSSGSESRAERSVRRAEDSEAVGQRVGPKPPPGRRLGSSGSESRAKRFVRQVGDSEAVGQRVGPKPPVSSNFQFPTSKQTPKRRLLRPQAAGSSTPPFTTNRFPLFQHPFYKIPRPLVSRTDKPGLCRCIVLS